MQYPKNFLYPVIKKINLYKETQEKYRKTLSRYHTFKQGIKNKSFCAFKGNTTSYLNVLSQYNDNIN
jgi:hypothetical protein